MLICPPTINAEVQMSLIRKFFGEYFWLSATFRYVSLLFLVFGNYTIKPGTVIYNKGNLVLLMYHYMYEV